MMLPGCFFGRAHATWPRDDKVYTFSSAMNACESRSCWTQAAFLLSEMRLAAIEPNVVTCACSSSVTWNEHFRADEQSY